MIKPAILFLATCTFPGCFGLLSLDNIYSTLQDLTWKYPKIVQRIEIGKSFEGRPIYAISIYRRSQEFKNAKITMVVEFGIHAREWASPTSAVFLLQQFVTNPACEGYTKKIKWYVIPVTNPDGYHFSLNHDRFWRKNRRKFLNPGCIGVDLNRNFPTGWDKGLSENLCRDTYSGPHNFSEPESIALDGFIKDLVLKENVTAYVAVHSCAQSILHPYGYSLSVQPSNLQLLQEVGKLMGEAIERVAGNYYPVKAASELYEAGGGSDDWAYKEQSIPLVYTLELGYESSPFHKSCFHPNEFEMKILVRECFAALGAVAKFLDSSIGQEREKSSTPLTAINSNITTPTQCPSKSANSVAATVSFVPLVVLYEAMVIYVLWIQLDGAMK